MLRVLDILIIFLTVGLLITLPFHAVRISQKRKATTSQVPAISPQAVAIRDISVVETVSQGPGGEPTGSDKDFNYRDYSTNPDDYRTWVDAVYEFMGGNFIVCTLIMAVPVFFCGYYLAKTVDFEYSYLISLPIYLGVFGIMLVSGAIRLASLYVHHAYGALRPCILIPDRDYKRLIDKWFKRFSNNRENLLWGWILTVAFCVLIFIALYRPDIFEVWGVEFLRPKHFSERGWFEPDGRFIKTLIIMIYAFHCGTLLATAIRTLALNVGFLLGLRHLPVLPILNLIKIRLEIITNFYVRISIAWFVGVSLFGYLFFDDLDTYGVVTLMALATIGVLTFLTPQYVYRLLLIRSTRLSSSWILAAFYQHFGLDLQEAQSVEYAMI